MSDIVIGKFTLESLSTGMYADPRAIYREYIQNATDSIDHAMRDGLVSKDDAEIHITINPEKREIRIRDNGTGISVDKVRNTLSDIGNSSKDYAEDRGFRGIGRLGGLAYCDNLYFITKAASEKTESMMRWDCKRMRELVSPSNNEIPDIVGVIEAITTIEHKTVDNNSHYFEVVMEGVIAGAEILIDEAEIKQYLSIVAPVDFDAQKFRQAKRIKDFFADKGQQISTYKIFFGKRRMPIYKLYTRRLDTSVGLRRKKENEYIKDVDLLYQEYDDGRPMYIGWLAITDFSGQIKDESLRGIRLRKNNILIGSAQTFDNYFPSEGYTANKMFAGEIHVLDENIIPNSQRDDFEPNAALSEMKKYLSQWAGEINKRYRRGTSNASSAMRRIEEGIAHQREIEERIDSGAISSEQKKEELKNELEKVQKQIKRDEATLRKTIESGVLEADRKQKAQDVLEKTKKAAQDAVNISTKIVKADYATKGDLPSSYSRDERKLYQRVIEVIDSFFADEHETAEKLRAAIIQELRAKKK